MTELAQQVDDALAKGHFTDAMDLLDSAGEYATRAEFLERRATAAYGAGRFEETITAWERLHGLLCEEGDRAGAARAAAMVAMFLLIDSALMAPIRGWLGRAEDLLDDADGDPVAALICAVRGYERFMCGDYAATRDLAGRSIELGRRHGNLEAEVIGRTASARVEILAGDVEAGLAHLDDVGAMLMSGEVDPLTTGMMLCEIVCAAQGLAKYDLAAEWTESMSRWGSGAAFGGLGGRCRVHRAEILRVSGPVDAAEDEALRACDDLRPWMRREFGWPLAELGHIRLRKGDLAGAEEALLAAHEHVWCPHPGLALLRLEQGDSEAATELIDQAIAHPFNSPSKERPPFVDLSLAPLHEARVKIAAATGDGEAARSSSKALRTISQGWESPWLSASADLADARIALLTGDHERGLRYASQAAATWADQGAPFETAEARVVLAEAHSSAGNRSSASLERRAALSAFEEYGAARMARQLRQLLRDDDRHGPAALEEPEEPVGPEAPRGEFLLVGDTRTVTFDGHTTTLGDLKGFRYMARMLAEPEREFHVLDLVAVEQGTLPTGSSTFVGPAELEGVGGQGLPALDTQARDAYRKRLAEVETDMEEARRCNDPARLELAENDRDYLIAELSRAVGLGGRLRAVGGDAERARTAVARALRYATDKLGSHSPELALHLRNSLHTGTYCSYRPDSLSAVRWQL
ncbi:MAG: hypothetical protein ACR2OH_01615 [Microthrixaceae bacterium]